ncbi:hypothetical protein F5876DRAFT_70362 [Lentinula aff. lateritia]|uniref:Uncharacterized protein n=1 Tax=Lentinula aff. lateritia TaxID=2804960 RepID=A0ACC1TJP1_9AGAR|nr:hypothetical protein F5876DRAFT_70362 [Lentinula aff. lateritia]
MIFPNKLPFILLVMTTSLCCMRLFVSVHASPLGATLKDQAQLNDRDLSYHEPPDQTAAGRIFLEIRKHDGFNALVHTRPTMRIQPSCFFRGGASSGAQTRYVPFQITVDQTKFSELDYLYSSTGSRSFNSRGKNPDKTIIVSPYFGNKKDPKSLDDLVLVFPNSLLLPFRESSDKNQNPLQIDAKKDQANSEKFADWRDWPKKIIDLPPDLKPRP